MTTLYVITRVLSYFGTELRAFFEHLVCRICRIPAEDVRPFKMSELCGHVEHELTKTKKEAFLMCWLPFTLNFILSCAFLLGGAYRIVYVGDLGTLSAYIFLWLGFSCAANCAPSFEDALSFKDCFYNKDTNIIIKILISPFFGLIYAMSFLERYSVTFLLAIGFTVAFPYAFNLVFPLIINVSQMLQ